MLISGTDLHNHILPGVDDGFRNEESSLEALSRLSALGCRSIVFTPHLNPEVYPDSDENSLRARYESFVSKIPEELALRTHLAAEYMLTPDFGDRIERGDLLCYSDRSILIEMSYFYKSDNLEQSIFELNMAGYKPILAHPERYVYFADNPEYYDRLRDMGCRLQLNYMSLAGVYGHGSMRILKYLLKRKMYDFISTDLHSLHQLDMILEIKPGFTLKKHLPRLLAQEMDI